jgi:site-specific DNA-methyltransferase (adenine-specific)
VTNLILGDCADVMKAMPGNSVDMVLTSPPYDNLREYEGTLSFGFDDFKNVASQLFRVIKQGGCVVWIVNDATINGSETGTSFKQALYFKEIGFLLHDTMIWQKISPYQHKNRYIQNFEYMFVFSKGRRKFANLIKDRKNKWAGTPIHGTERQKNGEMKKLSLTQKSKNVKEFGARFNIWDILPDKNNKTGHPAVFPLRLAEDHIKTWSNIGDVVLDPFMGSGTTGVACLNLDRSFIGIEKCQKYFDIAKGRIENNQLTDTN